MPTARETAVRVGLIGWFGATVLSQHPFRKWNGLRRLDVYSIVIPDWRFFAPNPGIDDYHILFRDRVGPDVEPGLWTEVPFLTERNLVQLVWHPWRRLEKTVVDAATELIRVCADAGDRETVVMSVPYVTLLNHVRRYGEHDPNATHTEFVVASSDGYAESEEPMLLYVSEQHPLAVA